MVAGFARKSGHNCGHERHSGANGTRLISVNGTGRVLCLYPDMGLYRVHFVDHGGNVYHSEYYECDSDGAAIDAVTRRNAPTIGAGFEIWDNERLVLRHRN